MKSFRDLPISRKLILATTISAAISLIIAVAAITLIEVRGSRARIIQEIQTLADVVGNGCAASLVFDDPLTAEEALGTLTPAGNVLHATVFDSRGHEFSTWSRSTTGNAAEGSYRPVDAVEIEGSKLHIWRRILVQQDAFGVIHVVADLTELNDRLIQYLTTALQVLVLTLGVSVLLAGWVQGLISRPVGSLLRAARRVTKDGLYNVRVPRHSEDELGHLSDAFNEMLTSLEKQDYDLRDREKVLQGNVRKLESEIARRKKAQEALIKSEEQLRQAQKMEAVGKLAGGVAHDFNNLLTAIGGYSQLSLFRDDLPEVVRDNLREIERASNRAAALTRQLLAFSRRQILEPKVLAMNGIVNGIEKMLRRLIGEDVELVVRLDEGAGNVKADAGQMEQVILNLVVNARDAMPGGGQLIIETGMVRLDEPEAIDGGDLVRGTYVLCAVTDSGEGMDEPTRERIFEPFFTTKEQGKGTGLGLSTVYGIVKQSGGHIQVQSAPGRGARFEVYLPLSLEAVDEHLTRPLPVEVTDRSGHILVVEDEDGVRRLACEVLRRGGFEVTAVGNGPGAIEVYAQQPGEFDLVLTDVIMPKMNGKETVDRLRELGCQAKVLYMSGYTETAIVDQGVLIEGTPLLNKPFSPTDLLTRICEVLDADVRDDFSRAA